MSQEEFDELFEDEKFRDKLWILISLYLFVEKFGVDELYKFIKEKFKEE